MRIPTTTADASSQGKRFKRILAIGEAGVGKTTQFATLPGKKFMYFFDPTGLESLPDSKDTEFLEFLPDVEDLHLAARTLKKADDSTSHDTPSQAVEPKTWVDFEEDLQERMRTGYFKDFDWVGIDSLTTLSEICMDRVLHLAKRPGKHPEQSDWTAEMNLMRNTIRSLTARYNVFITAHCEPMQHELTKLISYQPLLTGKNRARIPLRFSEVLCFYKDVPPGKEIGEGEKYLMQIETSRERPFIRSTLPRKKGLKGPQDVTIDFRRPLEGQGLGKIIR